MLKMLETRNELELLIGLKLDHIPDEKIVQWAGWIKDPFPLLKSEVIHGIKNAVILNQVI